MYELPQYIIIVFENNHRQSIVCSTYATSEQERDSIIADWNHAPFYVQSVVCDYSMRGE